IIGLSVNLASARKNNFYSRVIFPAGLKNVELCDGIDLKIRIRVLHGIHVARLTSEVEKNLLSLDEVTHAVLVTAIRNLDVTLVRDFFYIAQVAAIRRDEAVHDRDVGTSFDQS